PICHARQESVLQPALFVVVRVWRIEEQYREGAVGEPDGERARGEGVIELGPRLLGAFRVDLDPVALRAQSRRDRGGGLAGPRTGIEQTDYALSTLVRRREVVGDGRRHV